MMRELLVLSVIVCLAIAKPQYDGYSYESPNYQQNGFLQQQQQSQFLSAPLVQQTKSFDATQNFQQFQTYSSQEQFTVLPPTIVSHIPSHETQGSFQNDQSFVQQQQQSVSTSFNDLNSSAGFSSQPMQTDDLGQLQQSYLTQSTSENTDGTLDSFHIDSVIGPNPADIALSLQSTRDNTDSISVEAPTSNIPPEVVQQASQQQQQQPHASSPSVTIQKHIYIHGPPKDYEEPESLPAPVVQSKNKHYKIIFIKAPTFARQQIIQSQSQYQNKDKTIIYVLVKKPEEAQNIQALAQSEAKNNKPEVYFIKYKTHKQKSDTTLQQAPVGEVPRYNESTIVDERSKQPSHAPKFPSLQEQDISPEEQPINQETQNQYLPPN